MDTLVARRRNAPDLGGQQEPKWFPVLETIHLADEAEPETPRWIELLEGSRSSPAVNRGAHSASATAASVILAILAAGFICYAVGSAFGPAWYQ